MKKRKLNFDLKAETNSSDSYISEPAVIESEKGYRRLVFTVRPRTFESRSGETIESLTVESDNRALEYYLDPDSSVKFNEKSGTAEFTSGGKQYKIRALQEDDESWIINFRLPSKEVNS